ncbi:leucyl aminopeptidase family protein [Candidatus Kaiserbacteria bacterium]|nr:leucyl aminopeptidase family protein [Candidatus Kaiserbacteria bacterium]
MKISTNKNSIEKIDQKFCRLVITEDKPNVHRLVETKDNRLEYRLGAGKFSKMTARKFRLFTRSIIQATKSHQLENLAIDINAIPFPKTDYEASWNLSTLVENLILADYTFTKYKSSTKEDPVIKEILLCGNLSKADTVGLKRGIIVAESTNLARDIANTTADDLTPDLLAKVAKKALLGTNVKLSVLDKKAIKQAKMGLLEAVGKGSHNDPRFIIMEYYGAGKPTKDNKGKTKQPVILIGKGITFDTGGLNVKPSGYMHDMHLDMSGGSSVIGTMVAVAKLKLKQNIVALIPAAENAVSDKAMRAGDIVTAMNGKTVEILHTDAEGRLVLADALTYSERFKPRAIIDVATLTGAALVALGQYASAIMTKDEKLQTTLQNLGEQSGDYVWPLPLWSEYQSGLKSHRADYSNIDKNFSRYAGSIEGGTFLSFFAPKNVPWAHIDIAPRMDSVAHDKLTKGSAGEPVRLLVSYLEQA